jgi:hypothetical protein
MYHLCGSNTTACASWQYNENAVNAIPGDPGYDDPEPDDQVNNVMVRIHWSRTRHRRILRDGRKFARIYAPRRLQRGRKG